MPKRTDISSILIIGAGPIVIGQACEFDYSGTQAVKALKAEGYRVVLVNSNPATIMTDPDLADATYIEPIKWSTVAKIIEKERPDALLPTMGGQTALNCALDLERHGILEKFGVEMIGANADTIDKAEDRSRFDKAMKDIGLACPVSGIAHSMEEAYGVLEKVGFPCIIRPSFTMGGTGGGIAYNREEFEEICARGLDLSPTSELRIGFGFPQTANLLAAGIPVGLSVDTVELSGNADMFGIMKFIQNVENARSESEFKLTARRVLELATIEGARCAGLESKVGTLTPGKEADIVLLTADRLNVWPLNNAPGAVVNVMNPSNVDTVFIAGKLKKWRGNLVGGGAARVLRVVEEARDAVVRHAGFQMNLLG